MRKTLFIITLCLTAVFAFAVKTNAASLSFSPASSAFIRQCRSSVDVLVNISGQTSNAAEVLINYNPAQITIVDSDTGTAGTQVLKGPAYDALLINEVDSTNGVIRLVGGSITNILSSTQAMATIEFMSNVGVNSTSLSFRFLGVGVTNDQNDSNIADYTTSNDILTGVSTASFTFVSGYCPTALDITAPQVTFVTPTPDATGVALNTNIEIRVTDLGGVELGSMAFLVNNVFYSINEPAVTYSGTSQNYLFTIDPVTDLPADTQIIVVAMGRDKSDNSFAAQMSFNAPAVPGADVDPPVVTFTSPLPNAENVGLDSDVSFTITDVGSGIDLDSLLFFLNGVLYSAASAEVTITGSANAYQVVINPSGAFPDDQVVSLVISGSDLAGNAFLGQMQFNQTAIDPSDCPVVAEPIPQIITQIITIPGEQILENTILDNTVVDQIVTEIGVTGTGALVTGVGLGLNLLPLISMLNAPGFLISIIGILLGKKQGKPWGLVLDGSTNKPVPFATCRLYLSGALGIISQTVSDTEGRYGFVVPVGRYRLEVSQADYETGVQEVTIDEDRTGVFDIRLLPKGLGQTRLNFYQELKKQLNSLLKTLSPILFILGFVFSIVSLLISYSWLNLLIACAYLVAMAFIVFSRLTQKGKYAAVVDSKTGLRLPYALIKIFDLKTWTLVDTQTTNTAGQFDFWGEPGSYAILASVQGYTFPSSKQRDLKPIENKYNTLLEVKLTKGNNKLQLLVDPSQAAIQQANATQTNMSNPFS